MMKDVGPKLYKILIIMRRNKKQLNRLNREAKSILILIFCVYVSEYKNFQNYIKQKTTQMK